MVKKIEFFVPMEPVAQGRPEFSTYGGHVRAIDPKKSRDAKAYIRLVAGEAMGEHPPLEGALRLLVIAQRPVPKSASQRKIREMVNGVLMPTSKPDASNYQKTVEDALNGVVWKDDSQLVDARCVKRYSLKPGFFVRVTEYMPEEGQEEKGDGSEQLF